MKKIYLNIIIVLGLLTLVGAVSLSNIIDADLKTREINTTKQFEGDITYTIDKIDYTCYLSEDKIDAGDIASCLGCSIDSDNSEIICDEPITNIRDWNGNKLKQVVLDEGDYRYDFNETKLDKLIVDSVEI